MSKVFSNINFIPLQKQSHVIIYNKSLVLERYNFFKISNKYVNIEM